MKAYPIIRTVAWALMSLAGLTLCSQLANAGTITFTTDTSTTLEGSFSFTTSASNGYTDTASLSPSIFAELPDGEGVFGGRFYTDTPPDHEVFFGSEAVGTPGNPYFDYNPLDSLPAIAGYYTNDPGNVFVHFSIYNLQDTGGTTGTFSGNFKFAVPDSGATLVLLGIGVTMLLGLQRLMPGWARRG